MTLADLRGGAERRLGPLGLSIQNANREDLLPDHLVPLGRGGRHVRLVTCRQMTDIDFDHDLPTAPTLEPGMPEAHRWPFPMPARRPPSSSEEPRAVHTGPDAPTSPEVPPGTILTRTPSL